MSSSTLELIQENEVDVATSTASNFNTYTRPDSIVPSFSKTPAQTPTVSKKVSKKLEGYLCQFEGDIAIVHFLSGGEEIEYELPAEKLIKNGIILNGQPFEYIEYEYYDRVDGYVSLQVYTPKCKPEEHTKTSFDFDDETNELLKLILKSDDEED